MLTPPPHSSLMDATGTGTRKARGEAGVSEFEMWAVSREVCVAGDEV